MKYLSQAVSGAPFRQRLEVTLQRGALTHRALGVSSRLAALLDISGGCLSVDHDRG
jgi:hypothetical protein